MTRIELPWPPTANTYYRAILMQRRTMPSSEKYKRQVVMKISAAGRKYRDDVQRLIGKPEALEGRLHVHVDAYPPDCRRRDLDNILKALQDSLEHAGVYRDDSQIDRISVQRHPSEGQPGRVVVELCEVDDVEATG